MSKQQEYEGKNLTYTENFQIFREYIVERSNSSDPKDKILQRHLEKLTIPAFKETLSNYYRESEGVFFKGSKVDILAKHLTHLYEVKSTALTNDAAFSKMFTEDKRFQAEIKDEAKNLHSGTTFFSVDLATREIRQVRIENNRLTALNHKLNSALTNLVGNIKAKFGVKDVEIDKMMATEVKQEKQQELGKPLIGKTEGAKDFNVSM